MSNKFLVDFSMIGEDNKLVDYLLVMIDLALMTSRELNEGNFVSDSMCLLLLRCSSVEKVLLFMLSKD